MGQSEPLAPHHVSDRSCQRHWGCPASPGSPYDHGYGLRTWQSATKKSNVPFSMCDCGLPVLLYHRHWTSSPPALKLLTLNLDRNDKAEPGLQWRVGLAPWTADNPWISIGASSWQTARNTALLDWWASVSQATPGDEPGLRASQPPHCFSLFSRPVIFTVYC